MSYCGGGKGGKEERTVKFLNEKKKKDQQHDSQIDSTREKCLLRCGRQIPSNMYTPEKHSLNEHTLAFVNNTDASIIRKNKTKHSSETLHATHNEMAKEQDGKHKNSITIITQTLTWWETNH